MAVSPPALALHDVSLAFRGVNAVNGVSFAVDAHEVVGLIGPNGAGKTSVFNLISGIYRPDAGSITVFGHRADTTPVRRIAQLGVARTFQNLNLFPTMTVAQNVMLGRHLHRRGGVLRGLLARNDHLDGVHHNRVRQVLDLCDLTDAADVPAVALSYGAQKRVEFARAVAMEPQLLLLDEPAAGMNASEKATVAATVARVASELGCAVLAVEHDVAFVRQLADRLIVLDLGVVIADGAPAEVLDHADVRTAYLGEPART